MEMLMSAFEYSKKWIFGINKNEYQNVYSKIRFLPENLIWSFEQQRRNLLNELKLLGVNSCNNSTKYFSEELAPGCKKCSAGQWSCLFINGICNADCFYCPSVQNEIGNPSTNLLEFNDPQEFVDYIKFFGFTGVSISGGEPLLTLERTYKYLDVVKKQFGDKIHFWMYTNGKLLTDRIVDKLASLGLDEIRFDISADHYSLDKARLAVGKIKTVSVEIPAIPEDEEILKDKIRMMKRIGINHLNLHQLRLTEHNSRNLLERNYTFSHGPKIAVLESELLALRMLLFSKKNVNLPVNYCSFIYKNRYQKKASRERAAQLYVEDWENITSNGYIRRLAISSFRGNSQKIINYLVAKNPSGNLWKNVNKTIVFNEELLDYRLFGWGKITVQYSQNLILPNLTYKYPFKIIKTDSKSFYVEKRMITPEMKIEPQDMYLFLMDDQTDDDVSKPRVIPESHSQKDVILCLEKPQQFLFPYL